MKWIYKVTYQNGKIYIGKDLTGNFAYFGSPDPIIIRKDFSDEAIMDFTIRREILWSAKKASDSEVNKMEILFIKQLDSNNPEIGYNRWPKHTDTSNL